MTIATLADLVASGVIGEDEPHRFSAFASDLYDAVPELHYGWPREIATSAWNGQKLVLSAVDRFSDGSVVSATYRQAAGCVVLKLFND